MRPATLLSSISQDLRYTFRSFGSNPGFTVVVILTLGAGIGANTSLFSVIDSVLIRPLPFRDPQQLVTVWNTSKDKVQQGYSDANLLEARERQRPFEHLAGWTRRAFTISSEEIPERIDGMRVSWDFFRTLGVTPARGRSFREDEDRPGAPRVAVLSYGLWQRVLGGDSAIVGRSITLDGNAYTVIGIMPQRFRFFYSPEIWVPLALERNNPDRAVVYLSAIGRLNPGLTPQSASAQWGGLVEPLRSSTRQAPATSLLVLCGAVGFLLLIACVNVANLLLARATVRRKELAIRASLGAGRPRIIRQLLTESIVLALLGGSAGALMATWSVSLLPALVPPDLLSGCSVIAVDWRVLLFTLAVSVFTGILFGVLPAWQASKPDVHEILKVGASGAASLKTGLRSALVVAEVSLSLVLLICAGLFLRSLFAMQKVDLGFRPDHVLTMRLSTGASRPGPEALRALYREVLAKTVQVPGVSTASLALGPAPWDSPIAGMFDLPGRPPASKNEMRGAVYELVTPDYFRTVGMRIRKGRAFSDKDDERAPRVAIVNETFVRLFFKGTDPLGQKVKINEFVSLSKTRGPVEMEIVGVAADLRFGGPTAPNAPFLYMPLFQAPLSDAALSVRTAADPETVASTIRAALAQVDRGTPVSHVRTLDEIVTGTMAQPRMQTWLMSVFAAIALMLSALGTYGVMQYAVARSLHDLGVRIALGATRPDVFRLVFRKALAVTGTGVILGITGSVAAVRLISKFLFQVKPTDPATFAAVAALMTVVALAAAYVPARRATRVDPVIALRAE